MRYYIDPGTGSMLFAILIGIIGTLNYLIRVGIVKLRFVLSGGKKVDMGGDKIPYVIFSDNKRYWNVFEPICREFDRRGIDVVYLTASPDDPVLNAAYPHIKGSFIGSNNRCFAKLNFLRATIVLATTPGLDVYQWKRSKEVQYYVHILHTAGEALLYRVFGLDYYDAVLVSGDFQVNEIRKLENLRKLPAKEIYRVGIPYMDEMAERLRKSTKEEHTVRTVLLAPSWGPSAILSKYGEGIISELLQTGYHIIIRPHPQSFDSEKEMIENLQRKYPESDQLEWNRDMDNFEVLQRSDIMVSDFSGVILDFALVYDKPVIYTGTEINRAPYDAWWIKEELWTSTAFRRIGMKLTQDKMGTLKDMIDNCIESPEFAEGREEVRGETWGYRSEGAKRTVDWLIAKYNQLTTEEDVKTVSTTELSDGQTE